MIQLHSASNKSSQISDLDDIKHNIIRVISTIVNYNLSTQFYVRDNI